MSDRKVMEYVKRNNGWIFFFEFFSAGHKLTYPLPNNPFFTLSVIIINVEESEFCKINTFVNVEVVYFRSRHGDRSTYWSRKS